MRVFFYKMLPNFETALFFWKISQASSVRPSGKQRVNDDKALLEWYWQGKTRNTRRKTCPTATLSTINHTWTDLGSNPAFVMTGRRQTALHNTAVTGFYNRGAKYFMRGTNWVFKYNWSTFPSLRGQITYVQTILLWPTKCRMSMCNFKIKTVHLQHVSIFHRPSSGRPYFNQ